MNATLPNTSQANAHTKTRATIWGLSLVLLLAGTLLVGFSMGRWLAPLAAWIGPVLIMRYARAHKGWRGYPFIFAAYILAFVVGFMDIWLGAGWPMPLLVSLPLLYGFLWSLPYLADRLVGARLTGFARTLVYPLAATTLEFVNIYTNPVGMWGATGFTQYGDLPLMQLASVTGMIGITFLMGWFASVLNWAWENRSRGGEALKGLAAFGAVLAAVYVFGFLRLNLSPLNETEETLRVAGITSATQREFVEQAGGVEAWISDPASPTAQSAVQSHWEAYFAETEREARAGAQLVMWNEAAGFTSNSDLASLTARAQDVAKQNGIYLAVPLAVFYPADTGKAFENTLLLIDPTGAIVLEHVKYGGSLFEGHRLVGDGKLQTVETSFGVLSGVICYDMDYPAVIRQAGQNGTSLMLVPSKDWFEIDPLHSQMAVFFAIENGMSLVRQTELGLSIAVDAYGRVLAQTDFFNSADRTMVAQVPTQHVATIYTAFGRWFEWLCLAGFLVVVAWSLFARRATEN